MLTLPLPRDGSGTRNAVEHRLSRRVTGRSGSTTAVAATVASGPVPVTKVGDAAFTGAAHDTIGMEASMLVERDEVVGVR